MIEFLITETDDLRMAAVMLPKQGLRHIGDYSTDGFQEAIICVVISLRQTVALEYRLAQFALVFRNDIRQLLQIANNDGTWTYTWQNGRELASMSNGSTTWNYTYDANGMRTSRSNGSTTYNYVYNGSQLVQMTKGSDALYFTYGAIGPTTVTWNGTTYYYAVNAQGDVMGKQPS